MKTNIFFFLAGMSLAGVAQAQGPGFEWAQKIGNTAGDMGKAVTTDTDGNVYHTGSYSGTVDFDNGPGTSNLTAVANGDIYVCKTDSLGNLVWAKSVGGPALDEPGDITVDDSGNVFVTGSMFGSGDFDPGPGTWSIPYSGGGTADIFILKLKPNGDLAWAAGLGSSANYDQGYSLQVDGAGYVYVTGYFNGTIDFDPGTGIANLTALGTYDIFILKLSPSGNFKYVKGIYGGGQDSGRSMVLDNDANIYIMGEFEGTVDFNPGTGTANLTGIAGEAFLLKLDSAGNYQWAKKFGGSGYDYGKLVSLDAAGNIYCAGNFEGTGDFNPSASVFNLTSSGTEDVFLVKLDAAGNFIWAKNIGGAGIENIYGLSSGSTGVTLQGVFSGTTDFDPGAGIFNLTATGAQSSFLSKFDAAGNFVWARTLNCTSGAGRIWQDSGENLYFTGGFSGTGDFDPGVGTYNLSFSGSTDTYIGKWSKNICSDFAVIVDTVASLTCSSNGYGLAFTTGGQAPINYSWNTIPVTNDDEAFFDSNGMYEVSAADANGCTNHSSIYVFGPDPVMGFDLNAFAVAETFRPGLTTKIQLETINERCTPMAGQLKFVLSSFTSYQTASPLPDMISGDTLIWNFTGMNYDSAHFKPWVKVQTYAAATIGTILHFYTIVQPLSGDGDMSNNHKHYTYPVMNSFDPNDKQVYPRGACSNHEILNDQLLTYTIRFQNTGNASAINIAVIDSLDANLDLNTVRVTGSSHGFVTEVMPGNVLKFRFDNIYLADSTSDEPNSHGYIVFEAMPLPALVNGTVIDNKVGIYFDFNEPVITNTVYNTITDTLVSVGQLLNASFCAGGSYVLNSVTYNTPGNYIQYLLTADGCDSIVHLTLTADSVNTGVLQSGNTLDAMETTPGTNYQWLDCNNSYAPIAGQTNQTFTATVNGSYAALMMLGSCADTTACYNIISTTIQEVDMNRFKLMPNPAAGYFNIVTEWNDYAYHVFTSDGKTVLHGKGGGHQTIQTQKLENGIYYVKISSDGLTETYRVSVIH